MRPPELDRIQPEEGAVHSTATTESDGQSGGAARPEGAFDYGVIGLSSAIVAVTVYLAIRYLLDPGEPQESHIKRTILEEDP